MKYQEVSVIENERVAQNIYSLTVPCGEAPLAGQFFMLRRPDAPVLLPRAVGVCDWEAGVLRFLYQVVGPGTAHLAALRPEDRLCMTGPLGNGFPLESLSGTVALAGGGIGAAPMLYTARLLRARGVKTRCALGYRDEAFLADELADFVDEVQIATESGARGHKGFVTDVLDAAGCDAVLACGPTPMLRAVVRRCAEAGTPVYVSLENKMACGLGACLVCTCTDKDGKNHRTCKDGPVFRGEAIDFDA